MRRATHAPKPGTDSAVRGRGEWTPFPPAITTSGREPLRSYKPTTALLSLPRTNDHQRSCSSTTHASAYAPSRPQSPEISLSRCRLAAASAVVGSQRECLGDLSDPARDCVASANGYVFIYKSGLFCSGPGALENFSQSASVALPGPRGRMSSAGVPWVDGVLPASAAGAARDCSLISRARNKPTAAPLRVRCRRVVAPTHLATLSDPARDFVASANGHAFVTATSFPQLGIPTGEQQALKSAGRAAPDAADLGGLSVGRGAVKALASGSTSLRALRVTAPRHGSVARDEGPGGEVSSRACSAGWPFELHTTYLRPAPRASAGTRRGVPPAYATQITKPAQNKPTPAQLRFRRRREATPTLLATLNDPARDSVASPNGWVSATASSSADLALRHPDLRIDPAPRRQEGGIS
jgi:hypothetical protein